jgi:hypothetical protein
MNNTLIPIESFFTGTSLPDGTPIKLDMTPSQKQITGGLLQNMGVVETPGGVPSIRVGSLPTIMKMVQTKSEIGMALADAKIQDVSGNISAIQQQMQNEKNPDKQAQLGQALLKQNKVLQQAVNQRDFLDTSFRQDIRKEEIKAGLQGGAEAEFEDALYTNEDGSIRKRINIRDPQAVAKARAEGLQPEGAAGTNVTVNLPKAAPSSERETLVKLFDFRSQLTRLSKLNDPKFTGRFEGGILGALKEITGLAVDDREVQFRQVSADLSDTLLRLRSGAQINEEEYQRMLRLVPTPGLPDKVFVARMNSLITQIDNSIENRRRALGESGFIAPTQGGAQNDLSQMSDAEIQETLNKPIGGGL